MLRRVLVVFGVAFTALGFAVVVDPTLARRLNFPPIPTVMVAGLGAVFGVAAYIRRRHTSFRDASDDEDRNALLEGRYEPPRPGANVDAQIREGAGERQRSGSDQLLRDRIRAATVQALADARGISPADAHRQLDDGTWTDDRTAASFFSNDVEPPAPDLVGTIVNAESLYERQAGHVIRELRRITRRDGGDA